MKRYWSINCHEGKNIIAVVEGENPPYVVDEGYDANCIAGVKVDGCEIRVRDANGHVFLTVTHESPAIASTWALTVFGYACTFDGA